MIETALSGLLWAQENLPTAAYVDAVWAARYPDFANGNEPKSKGTWPFERAWPVSPLSSVNWSDHKAANVIAIKSRKRKAFQDRIAGAVAQIAEQVHAQAKTL